MLDRLFPPERRAQLARSASPAPSEWDSAGAAVRERHLVFDPTCDRYAARRATWLQYVTAAETCGLLDANLLARLTDTKDDQFRGAIGECATAAFFLDRGAVITPRPAGRPGKNPDMRVTAVELDAIVEVKAPYVPIMWKMWSGNDAGVLRACIHAAGKQFAEGVPNLLVITPTIRTPVCYDRDQLLEAVVGEHTIVVPVALEDGVEVPEPYAGFKQNGKLARLRGSGPVVSTDLTRIGAVMSLEEVYDDGKITQRAVVVHNPFATAPISNRPFDPFPQWIRDADDMYWIPPRKPT